MTACFSSKPQISYVAGTEMSCGPAFNFLMSRIGWICCAQPRVRLRVHQPCVFLNNPGCWWHDTVCHLPTSPPAPGQDFHIQPGAGRRRNCCLFSQPSAAAAREKDGRSRPQSSAEAVFHWVGARWHSQGCPASSDPAHHCSHKSLPPPPPRPVPDMLKDVEH